MRTLLYDLLHKVLKLVPLIATGPEVYVTTMNKVILYTYSYLEETLNHVKCLKLKDHLEENSTYFCAAILVYAERLEGSEDFKNEHHGYITRIFENNSDPRFHRWETHKYKEVTEFIKRFGVCDEDVM